MKTIQSIELHDGSREEHLPGFAPAFPYIATRAELDRYLEPVVPWHWHRAVELFYIQSGSLEYTTPGGHWVFPAGSGGFVNANVLHTSRFQRGTERNLQLLHLFDPVLLAGEHGSRIETRYILPLTTSGAELIPLYPEDPAQAEILTAIREAFALNEQAWGGELALRAALADIWMKLLALPSAEQGGERTGDDKIKRMMVYIHEHDAEPISVEQLAQAALVSKRACFRLFQEHLHTTPTAYIRSYRLRKACRMLAQGQESITQIASLCGLGSSSYFGKLFREAYHCTPLEYRRRWHDRDKNGQ